jgi:hypothetical protein
VRIKWYRHVVWGDRKHWELVLGSRRQIRVGRWCAGAPCHLTSDNRHELSFWRVKSPPRVDTSQSRR